MLEIGEYESLEAALNGEPEALGDLLEQHRPRLHRMVALRLDPRLHARVDASDVLQEAFLDVSRDLPRYLESPQLPFYMWLRLVIGGRLLQIHRRHLGTEKRSAQLEIRVGRTSLPAASTVSLARALAHSGTSPSQAAIRTEEVERLEQALDGMNAIDREILALRYYEQLSNQEVALALGLTERAASARHVRALKHLGKSLGRAGLPAGD